MEKLSNKNLLLIGLTLFSMFFGAGNLIFPPFLGAQAGAQTWVAFIGLSISAIGLPILGVIAVTKAGGLKSLSRKVHPYFASVFTFLIYLSIGPCLAIPRTSSTSFEMAVTPFLGQGIYLGGAQLIYSIAFFTLALILALKPDKLTDRLGKVLSPALLLLICVIFIASVLNPIGGYGDATGGYVTNALSEGFLYGYMTMDAIAALNFGIIISMNIRAKGVTEEKYVVREIIKAGTLAAVLFFAVYGALTHVGAMSAGAFGIESNGAKTLIGAVTFLFGKSGVVILALLFFIACLNTCVGLICCCSEYFNSIMPKVSYKKWAVFFAVISMVVSNAGLDMILIFSVPVLNCLYPPAIVLIVMSFLSKKIKDRKFVFPISILLTTIVGIIYALEQINVVLPIITESINLIPLYDIGLGWILPAIIGTVIGFFASNKTEVL